MAMGVNKVIYGTTVLVDLTEDTVTPETLVEGATAHGKDGGAIIGTNPYAKAETDAEVDTQYDLLTQISSALNGKGVGGGGGAPTTVSGIDLHDSSADELNTYLSSGKITAYNGWKSTDYIPLEEGKFYVMYSPATINLTYCALYNSSKTYTQRMDAAGFVQTKDKAKPAFVTGNGGYIRLSGTNAQIDSLEVYEVINFAWEWEVTE